MSKRVSQLCGALFSVPVLGTRDVVAHEEKLLLVRNFKWLQFPDNWREYSFLKINDAISPLTLQKWDGVQCAAHPKEPESIFPRTSRASRLRSRTLHSPFTQRPIHLRAPSPTQRPGWGPGRAGCPAPGKRQKQHLPPGTQPTAGNGNEIFVCLFNNKLWLPANYRGKSRVLWWRTRGLVAGGLGGGITFGWGDRA